MGVVIATAAAAAAGWMVVMTPAPAVAMTPSDGTTTVVLVKDLVAAGPTARATSTPNGATATITSTIVVADDGDVTSGAAPNAAAATTPTAKLDGKDPVSKLFQQGRVLESQGNYDAALQIYQKVTALRPGFVYGWSNLGNAQVVFKDLDGADESYSTAVSLCRAIESAHEAQEGATGGGGPSQLLGLSSSPKCDDLYVILLNRGSLRLNHNQPNEALKDLEQSSALRARPDAVILQNLARAKELNGNYAGANDDYDVAVQMTSGDVAPFWLRSALVKYQLGNVRGGFDLLKRVRNRFPDAPEVKAAYAVFLYTAPSQPANSPAGSSGGADDPTSVEARQLFLEIPDRARLQFSDPTYVATTIGWPPAMAETLRIITKLVGDRPP
jgi:tetratricopeptide (TPR) repeat protein